jgi:hypothetical protein
MHFKAPVEQLEEPVAYCKSQRQHHARNRHNSVFIEKDEQ